MGRHSAEGDTGHLANGRPIIVPAAPTAPETPPPTTPVSGNEDGAGNPWS